MRSGEDEGSVAPKTLLLFVVLCWSLAKGLTVLSVGLMVNPKGLSRSKVPG